MTVMRTNSRALASKESTVLLRSLMSRVGVSVIFAGTSKRFNYSHPETNIKSFVSVHTWVFSPTGHSVPLT